MKGYLLIRYLWTQVMESIHEMSVVNTDATSYHSRPPEKCMYTAEKKKKNNFLDACLKHCQHFNPFATSLDGLLGVKAGEKLEPIVRGLATNWREIYSHTCKYAKSRVAITLIRAIHCCIYGSGVMASQISMKHPLWEDGADLHFFR